MELAGYVVRQVIIEKKSIRSVAVAHGISKSWLAELCARYREGGDAALVARSTRPHHSPSAISEALEDEIVLLRKHLLEEGFDAGAVTIHTHLSRRYDMVPSVNSIWRVLTRRGFIIPTPQRRPKSSYTTFEADLPNECWQMDMTHAEVFEIDGRSVEVLNVIDDHSRFCLASTAFPVVRSTDVVSVFLEAGERYGLPASVLSDNGAIFTSVATGGRCAMETMLMALDIAFKHSRPYHPQTCGKVERFHQTMKRFLAKQDEATSIEELQQQLDRFRDYYNEVRPHRSKNRRTPAEVFGSRAKAGPPTTVSQGIRHYRVRHDRVDRAGKVTLRYQGELRSLHIGYRYRGTRVVLLVADADVRTISEAGELIGLHTVDATKKYQANQLT